MRFSLKYKLLLLVLPPMLVAVAAVVVAGSTLIHQNASLSSVLNSGNLRNTEAKATVISILVHQKSLNTLIAVDEKADIRSSAIAVIRAGSALDEQIQKLLLAMPDNEQVRTLQSKVAEIRPIQMKVIGHAKRNRDEEALVELNRISDDSSAIVDAASNILNLEFQKLVALSSANKESTNKTLTLIGISTLLGLLLAAGVTLILNR